MISQHLFLLLAVAFIGAMAGRHYFQQEKDLVATARKVYKSPRVLAAIAVKETIASLVDDQKQMQAALDEIAESIKSKS